MSETSPNHNAARSLWSSRLSFILVSAGAAIGLGNIWRFPYMAGENGGGVFVLTYLIFLVCIGVPAMIAELLIGRRGRQNPVGSLQRLAKESGRTGAWAGVGWLGALTLVMVLSFYSVISGVSIAYLNYALQGAFATSDPTAIVALWDNLMSQPAMLVGWHSAFMVMTMGIVAFGVNKGIERSSKWMMPALFVVLILLVVYSAWIGNFQEAVNFLFSFKVQDFTAHAALDALGQAFFTLATGAGAILIYGSYLSKKTNILNTVVIISGLDLLVALLSGLAIFPIVFANGLSPDGGPGLMFKVLPLAFSQMPGTNIVSVLFFLLLIFAAWTSSLSMAEPLVSLLTEKRKISRMKASFCIGLLAWSLGLLCALAFSSWSDITLFKWHIDEIMIGIPTNILLPTGAFLFCVFVGWVMEEKYVADELQTQSKYLYRAWRFSIRYLCPTAILIVLLAPLLKQ
tara:strand:+ start:60283 stop:61653 length:1371 start_codon:yes stop_codon:yes gene_type:complete